MIADYRYRRYACTECGHEKKIQTNHFGQCYSWGAYNACPKCPPFKRPTVWTCQENPPEDMDRPPDWTVEK